MQGDDLSMGRGSPGMVSPQPYGRETSRKSVGKSSAPQDNIFGKYIAFAVFGKGAAMAEQAQADPGSVLMDSKGFAKFCKECRIMRGRLDLTRVDLIFTKFCNKVCSLPPCILHQPRIVNSSLELCICTRLRIVGVFRDGVDENEKSWLV